MKLLGLDFETYYSSEYTLRKMTPAEYILDPRFELIGCAVKHGEKKSFWVDGKDFGDFIWSIPPEETKALSHNQLFDACILSYRYGWVPRLMIDTLGMSRALLGSKLRSLSLASVAKYLGLQDKGGTIAKVIGMRAADIKASRLWGEYKSYALDDVDICYGIYKLLASSFPPEEFVILNDVLRAAVVPQFQLDMGELAFYKLEIEASKFELLRNIGITDNNRETLMSNDKFAGMLQDLGVDPPRKVSGITGKVTWAFSKSDVDFMELEEHEDPRVQTLVATRLGIKSTIEETRTQRFLNIANMQWADGGVGAGKCALMPMPLRYAGAHTHRLSGDWKLNVQNIGRNSTLRKAILAPEGYTILDADSSQIEARFVAALSGCEHLRQLFENREDVYATFASTVFGFPVNKRSNPIERFIGKTAVLGLGYGLGWEKFQRTIKLQSKQQTGTEVLLSDEDAQRIVALYRSTYPEIPAFWRRCNNLIQQMTNEGCDVAVGPVRFQYQSILLPNGLRLHYEELEHIATGWQYKYATRTKRVYGGSITENLCQALARIAVMQAALRLRKRLVTFGVTSFALQCHDALAYLVPDQFVSEAEPIILEEMRRRPVWLPQVPLDAEIAKGKTYATSK